MKKNIIIVGLGIANLLLYLDILKWRQTASGWETSCLRWSQEALRRGIALEDAQNTARDAQEVSQMSQKIARETVATRYSGGLRRHFGNRSTEPKHSETSETFSLALTGDDDWWNIEIRKQAVTNEVGIVSTNEIMKVEFQGQTNSVTFRVNEGRGARGGTIKIPELH